MATIVQWLNSIKTGHFKLKPEVADKIDGAVTLVGIILISIGSILDVCNII